MEQAMIVLPVRLTEMLNDVDGARAATLALDFAEHAANLEAEALTQDMREVIVEYVASAREAVALGRANERLVRALDSLFTVGWRTPYHPEDIHLLDSAVRFACQDMLIEAGALNKIGRTRVTCQYIARTAQSIVGSRSAARAAEGADRRMADRARRWEEARWQLQHVVATEPNPHV